MKTLLFNYITIILVGCFLFACAVIKQPDGGKKDVVAPQVIKQNPPNGTINFLNDNIELIFNEKIEISNERNIIISPPFLSTPEFQVKSKSLIIKTKGLLEKNKTYSIIINDVVSDITEKNKVSSIKFVFSTGNSLDSCKIRGVVKDAYTLQPVKDATILLLGNSFDSLKSNFRNNYIYGVVKSDVSGNFNIENLKENGCWVYAIEDKNNNILFDTDEKIAFVEKKIELCKDTIVELYLFQNFTGYPKIKNILPNNFNKILIAFDQPVDSIKKIELMEDKNSLKLWSELNHRRDTLTIWSTNDFKPTSVLSIHFPDTKIDTVITKTSSKKSPDKLKLDFINDIYGLSGSVIIKSSLPLTGISSPNTRIYKNGKLLSEEEFDFIIINSTLIKINHNYDFDCNYLIEFDSNSIQGINSYYEKASFSFKTKAINDLGTLSFNIINKRNKQNLIYELVSENDKVIRKGVLSDKSESTLKFENLIPGKYRFKYFSDDNKNYRWDNGNLYRNVLPEKIWYYENLISLKENWELENLIILID